MIRPARAGDADAIAAIWNTVIRDTLITFTSTPKTTAEIIALIHARGPAMLVLDCGGQVQGFALFGPFRSGPGYAHVAEHSLYLAPELRGQGQGAALLAQLEDAARQQGISILVAAISGANPRAVTFHAAHGFAQTGHLPGLGRKGGHILDLVLMQKTLSGPTDTARPAR
ncbi:MAG: GNAT family N-acetyltransferase [Marinibacterium sp.]|nr:GNAT family N-acetyltransferase [Marinibacterium sp.]